MLKSGAVAGEPATAAMGAELPPLDGSAAAKLPPLEASLHKVRDIAAAPPSNPSTPSTRLRPGSAARLQRSHNGILETPASRVYDDEGWAAIAGRAAPEDEVGVVQKARFAWARGVAAQAQRCGHLLTAKTAMACLQQANGNIPPTTLISLATATTRATDMLRTFALSNAGHSPTAVAVEELKGSPPAITDTSAGDGKTQRRTSRAARKGGKNSADKYETEDGDDGAGEQAAGVGGEGEAAEDSQAAKKDAKKLQADEDLMKRENTWIVASDEAWTGRNAAISRIQEQKQLSTPTEVDPEVLVALRQKLRAMTPLELRNEVKRTGISHASRHQGDDWPAQVNARQAVGAGPADDELQAAKRACPRLNLLTSSQLVSLLHMTHPEQIADLWSSICSFDDLMFQKPPLPSSCTSCTVASLVVGVVQRQVKGRAGILGAADYYTTAKSTTLRLIRPYSTARFALSTSAEAVPQAEWLEGLFRLIRETQQTQLQIVRERWLASASSSSMATSVTHDADDTGPTDDDLGGPQTHLCQFLLGPPLLPAVTTPCTPDPADDGGDEMQSRSTISYGCSLQVVMLALQLQVSEMLELDELNGKQAQLMGTDAGGPIEEEKWEAVAKLLQDELIASRCANVALAAAAEERGEQQRQGAWDQGLLCLHTMCLSLRKMLHARDLTRLMRFRLVEPVPAATLAAAFEQTELQGQQQQASVAANDVQVEVSMLISTAVPEAYSIDPDTSIPADRLRTNWYGCKWGWEPHLSFPSLIFTDDTMATYRAMCAQMPIVDDDDQDQDGEQPRQQEEEQNDQPPVVEAQEGEGDDSGAVVAAPVVEGAPTARALYHTTTTVLVGEAGLGKTEKLIQASQSVFGTFHRLITGDQVSANSSFLAYSARALAKFPFFLILRDANCIARPALEDAMAQPRFPPSSFCVTYNNFAPEALFSDRDMMRILARNDIEELYFPDMDEGLLIEAAYANLQPICDDATAFLVAHYLYAGQQSRGGGSVIHRHASNPNDAVGGITMLRRLGPLLAAEVTGIRAAAGKSDPEDLDLIPAVFGVLGREVTFSEARTPPPIGYHGCGAGDVTSIWLHLQSVMGHREACRRYHQRLNLAVFRRGSTVESVSMLVDEHLAAGRAFHAADVATLLCTYPRLAKKLILLQDVEGGVAVGWDGVRAVSSAYLAVHISGCGEGAFGPGMLWAGLDARLLIRRPTRSEVRRKLTPKFLALKGALTTLELLPAIIQSPVAKELIRLPGIRAIIKAKWKLLRPYWALQFACFVAVLVSYMSFAVSNESSTRRGLLLLACVLSGPLLSIEIRQFTAIAAMKGVGNSDTNGSVTLKLSDRFSYFTLGNVTDMTSLVLVFLTAIHEFTSNDDAEPPTSGGMETLAQANTSAAVAADTSQDLAQGWRSGSGVALTVLFLCLKLVTFLSINKDMGFLVSVFTRCMHAMKQYLVVLTLVIIVFAITFHIEFASAETFIPGAPYGQAGSDGLVNALWSSFTFSLVGDFDSGNFVDRGKASMLFFAVMTMFVNVVMINVLIAIVSDAYAEMSSERQFSALRARAEAVFALDCLFPRKRCKAFSASELDDDAEDEGSGGDDDDDGGFHDPFGLHDEGSREEFHNRIKYLGIHTLLQFAYKERLRCAFSECTLHVLSAVDSNPEDVELTGDEAVEAAIERAKEETRAYAEALQAQQASMHAERIQDWQQRHQAVAQQSMTLSEKHEDARRALWEAELKERQLRQDIAFKATQLEATRGSMSQTQSELVQRAEDVKRARAQVDAVRDDMAKIHERSLEAQVALADEHRGNLELHNREHAEAIAAVESVVEQHQKLLSVKEEEQSEIQGAHIQTRELLQELETKHLSLEEELVAAQAELDKHRPKSGGSKKGKAKGGKTPKKKKK